MQRIDQPMLPTDWITVNLEEVAEIGQGGTPSTQKIEYWNGNIPWLRSGEINFNRIVDSQSKITELGIQNSSARLLPKGTVLLAMTGQGLTRGRAALLSIESSANQSCAHILPNRKVLNNEFLFYYFMKEYWNIRQIYKGSNQPGLNTSLIKKLRIPLTSPQEQMRIVSKIEELFSKLDTGTKYLKTSKILLKQYHQSVLKYAFEGKLTEKWREMHKKKLEPASLLLEKIDGKILGGKIRNTSGLNFANLPATWTMTTLGDLSVNHDGKRVPVERNNRKKMEGIYPYYGASGIIDYVNDYLFDGEYLLIGEDGANLLSRSQPIAFQAKGKFWVNNHAHVIQTKGRIPLSYLQHFINSIDLSLFVTGTAQPKLTKVALNKIPIPLTSLEEQNEIIREIQRRIIVASEVEDVIRQSLDQSQKLKQSILNMAFRGKLVQRHRDDSDILDLIQKFKA